MSTTLPRRRAARDPRARSILDAFCATDRGLARRLATLCGVGEDVVSRWRSGERTPTPEQAEALERHADVPARLWELAAEPPDVEAATLRLGAALAEWRAALLGGDPPAELAAAFVRAASRVESTITRAVRRRDRWLRDEDRALVSPDGGDASALMSFRAVLGRYVTGAVVGEEVIAAAREAVASGVPVAAVLSAIPPSVRVPLRVTERTLVGAVAVADLRSHCGGES